MSNNNNSSSSGIGILGLLGVAFVVLKLTKVINWSWWWVTSPFWGSIALFLIVGLIWLIVQLIRRNKKTNTFKEMAKPPRSKFAERLEEAKNKQLNK